MTPDDVRSDLRSVGCTTLAGALDDAQLGRVLASGLRHGPHPFARVLTAAKADGNGAAALFNYPKGSTLDSAGNIFIADTGNHTIRKVTPAGDVTTVAGTAGVIGGADGTGPAASFNAPSGLVTDALKQQLKVGGRIVAPETQRDGRQLLKVFEKRVAGFIEKTYEEVKFVPLLPGVVAA